MKMIKLNDGSAAYHKIFGISEERDREIQKTIQDAQKCSHIKFKNEKEHDSFHTRQLESVLNTMQNEKERLYVAVITGANQAEKRLKMPNGIFTTVPSGFGKSMFSGMDFNREVPRDGKNPMVEAIKEIMRRENARKGKN